MFTGMSVDSQTDAIPLVPVTALAVAVPHVNVDGPEPEAEVADASVEDSAADFCEEVSAREADADATGEESVQTMYQAGLATLGALHERWTAAIAELRIPHVGDSQGEAAA